jgi:hypothetical protein
MADKDTITDKLFRWNGEQYEEETAVFCPGCRVRLDYVLCDVERLSQLSARRMPGICPECDTRLFLRKLEVVA